MRAVLTCTVCLLLAGCLVGPDYRRPAAPPSPPFKERAGWKIGEPADTLQKGPWWSVYQDPELDRLERTIEISNQTVKQFEAQYRNAVAVVAQARSGLFPTLGVSPGVSRSAGGGGQLGATGGGAAFTQYSLNGTAAWMPDIWGSIRRQIESTSAAAQVGAADLANATLSAQATLATDYFDLRAEDSLIQILTETVKAERRAMDIAKNEYQAGTVNSIDYVTALALLQSTEASLEGVGVQRQQYEHAIAVLTGHAPAELTIAPAPLTSTVPTMPPGVPSALLERRPDIAAAERAMQQQNALIGVEVATYYPNISLSAVGGFAANPLSALFNAGNEVWSLGATGTEVLFSGGLRGGLVGAARANYDASVAAYRQTVLNAFQSVEDALSTLRILERQAKAEATAVASAQKALDGTLNEYKAGTVIYTAVITEQTLLLADQQTLLAIQQGRLVASVALIVALGGGWSTADLPAAIPWAIPAP